MLTRSMKFNRQLRISIGFILVMSTIILQPWSSTHQCVLPAPGLIGWWGFNNDMSDQWGMNDGIQLGGSYEDAVVGRGYRSGGQGSLVSVPDSPSFDLASFTIESHVRLDHLNTKNMPIVWKGQRGANIRNPYGFAIQGNEKPYTTPSGKIFGTPSPGKVLVFVSNGLVDHIVVSEAIIQHSEFTHIAATYTKGTVEIYIDGQLDTSISGITHPFDSIHSLQIGSIANVTTPNYFNGVIDELKIYNRALTATEVSAIYNTDSVGTCKQSNWFWQLFNQ